MQTKRELFWKFVLLSGVLATGAGVTAAVGLPLFVPGSTKWPVFPSIFSISIAAMTLGSWILLIGLFKVHSWPLHRFLSVAKKLLAVQLGGAALSLLIAHGALAFKMGELLLLDGPQAAFNYWGILLFLPAIGLAVSLFLEGYRLREHVAVFSGLLGLELLILVPLFNLYVASASQNYLLYETLPPAGVLRTAGYLLAIWGILLLLLSAAMLSGDRRKFFFLLLFSPLWIPFVLVIFFWSLLIDTSLYFIQELHLLGRFKDSRLLSSPPRWFRWAVLSWLSIVLFPLLLTLDFTLSLIRLLANSLYEKLIPPDERGTDGPSISPLAYYGTGFLLLMTAPLWILPAVFYWIIRIFIYETLLVSIFGVGEKSEPGVESDHQPGEQKHSPQTG